VFRFSVKHLKDKHLTKLSGYDVKAILSTLEFLLDHDWSTVTANKVKKYHLVPLNSCNQSIANHHSKCEAEETSSINKYLISFAYKDRGRILGFHDSKTFFVTYIDVDHKYC